ncbi:histidine phosphatase family protein [Ureibacillus acetophenoni]|uniref:2,3-bisphosphoglycerate-dependent phosphoglycerate mutase n=1 Tax=Ureibacillus acetophenoni TaxID=614649 RepID=A0A285UL76_9BACL|nr:histidine phosphatase family protein [Ureibacillus acetophenoni]SOC42640.1 2,3-bisphosphoglycerate-dependent phosphoglycerate mutase [Ureibacillus acetophenoni]
MANLYLARHAHSIYSPDELGRPLSEKGLADALKVTEILKSEAIDIVISSPYRRAIQTVQGIANLIGKDVEIHEGFKERILTSEPAEDFNYAITKVWEDENFSWNGGESNLVAQKRGIAAINQVLEQYKDQNVVIGTHGNIMVLIMKYFDQQYNFDFWKRLEMPDIYKLSFDGKSLVDVTRVWKSKLNIKN